MQISFRLGAFEATEDADPELMLKHGWLKTKSGWRTSHPVRVAPFVDCCTGEAAARAQAFVDERRNAIAASIAGTADIEIPVPPGLAYRPYQKAGIAFMAARHSSLNADVPRLGKTIQAIGVCNLIPDLQRVLVVCPANAKINWVREFTCWNVHGLTVRYCSGVENPETSALVLNYDILSNHMAYIAEVPWDVVIFDEAHYLKSPTAQRTMHCLGRGRRGGIKAFKHRLFLTGTPIYTRPIDLWPILQACDPDGLGSNQWKFGMRYCDAKHDGFGWRFDGGSNMEELQTKLRTKLMVRREKGDVLEELPSSRQTIVLPKGKLAPLVKRERNLVQTRLAELEDMLNRERSPEMTDAVLKKFGNLGGDEDTVLDEFTPVATVRRELALAKVGMCVEFISEVLQTESKVIVYAHHRDVVKALHAAFPGSACIIGGLTVEKREAERVRFQTDPKCQVIVGNMRAMGEAIELSAADVVIECELPWEPALLDQAEERPWLPTKTTPIQIYRLVVEDSIESQMAELLELRQENIERITSSSLLTMK